MLGTPLRQCVMKLFGEVKPAKQDQTSEKTNALLNQQNKLRNKVINSEANPQINNLLCLAM